MRGIKLQLFPSGSKNAKINMADSIRSFTNIKTKKRKRSLKDGLYLVKMIQIKYYLMSNASKRRKHASKETSRTSFFSRKPRHRSSPPADVTLNDEKGLWTRLIERKGSAETGSNIPREVERAPRKEFCMDSHGLYVTLAST